jgi:hypothetical protein
VWVNHVMLAVEVVGRVTTADRVAEYALNYDIDGAGQMTVVGRAYRRTHTIAPPASLYEILSELQSLDGQNWGCAVDGRSILVDGVVDGRRFAFQVSNPDFCDDDRSRLALRALNVVGPSTWEPIFGGRTER